MQARLMAGAESGGVETQRPSDASAGSAGLEAATKAAVHDLVRPEPGRKGGDMHVKGQHIPLPDALKHLADITDACALHSSADSVSTEPAMSVDSVSTEPRAAPGPCKLGQSESAS